MADLRGMFERAGATAVKSYVQSGNVVFTAPAREVEAIAGAVVTAMTRETGVTTWVTVRTAREMAAVIERNPFADKAGDPKTVHVAFFREPAATPAHGVVPDGAADAWVVSGREIFVYVPNGLSRSAFDGRFWSKDLALGTSRNWRTVTTLAEMAADET
jgi:uncharacterized protein (DUF1697 family)